MPRAKSEGAKPPRKKALKRCFREKHPDRLPQSESTATDCRRLIQEYSEMETVRFEEFVNLWKKKSYSALQ